MAGHPTAGLVAQGSQRFQRVYAQVGGQVRRTFPNAKEGVAYGMPGWFVSVPASLVPRDFKGTMDPKNAYVLLKEGKSGITLHVWNPADFNQLDKHRAELEAAGFDVMVGCIRWTKKSEYPVAQVADLLRGMKARLRPKEI